MALKRVVRDCVNASLRPLGVQVIRGRSTDPAIRPYRRARRTIAAARNAGLSVGEYIDRNFAESGATAATVEALIRLGELRDPLECVCEIGTGSGRYAEKIIAKLHPSRYESYETASDWWPHLQELPNLINLPTDGHTLASTESSSVDLVHAHKVFVYTPFTTTAGYLAEMARVVRPGGSVAFDIVTEDCLDEATVEYWVSRRAFYTPTPRGWAIDFLRKRGLSLQGNLFVAMAGGRTELLVFRRL